MVRDDEARRFPVSAGKQAALSARMRRFGIREEDIEEKFLRSSGPGGQNVNKTSTCVSLRHLPTGVEVKCARERSQGINRYVARMLLTEKIEERILGKQAAAERAREKIRRQKRKRSKRAKEKMLAAKKRQGAKKISRQRVSSGDD